MGQVDDMTLDDGEQAANLRRVRDALCALCARL
jgi:hypothetical protein